MGADPYEITVRAMPIPSAFAEGAFGDTRTFTGAAGAARADKARMTRAICERQPSRRLYGDEIKIAEKLFRAPPGPVGRRVAFFEKKAQQKSKTGAHLNAAGASGVPRPPICAHPVRAPSRFANAPRFPGTCATTALSCLETFIYLPLGENCYAILRSLVREPLYAPLFVRAVSCGCRGCEFRVTSPRAVNVRLSLAPVALREVGSGRGERRNPRIG